jgi:hypothetical protein
MIYDAKAEAVDAILADPDWFRTTAGANETGRLI